VHIVGLDIDQIEVRSAADQLIAQLQEHGQSVLFDDRTNVRAGAKFADADLIGIPTRIVISQKTVVLGKYELKRRDTNLAQMIVL
jgi:prolyl-tRNA synthetase